MRKIFLKISKGFNNMWLFLNFIEEYQGACIRIILKSSGEEQQLDGCMDIRQLFD
ncbi:MAG: hypothetical protein KIPDCIKN_02324 [Haliscomenobacter sp.]|nr:hypothetical protein [Haliscomenobacter sp.]